MDQTFRPAFALTVLGFALGAGYTAYLVLNETCAALLRIGGSASACSLSEQVAAGLVVFTLTTLAFTALTAARTVRARGPHDDGAVGNGGLGDTFLAIGSIVAMVQAAAFAVVETPFVLGLLVAVFALSLISVRRAASATREDREVATVISMVLTMAAVIWVALSPDAALLGMPLTIFWVLGALAYLDRSRAETPATWEGARAHARTES